MKTPLENACTYSTQKRFDKAHCFAVRHFQEKDVPRSTLSQILKRKEEVDSGNSGRPAQIVPESGKKQLIRLFDHKFGISQQQFARNMKCTQSLVNWALKIKTSIRKENKDFQTNHSSKGPNSKFFQTTVSKIKKILFEFLTMNLILAQLTAKSTETIISTRGIEFVGGVAQLVVASVISTYKTYKCTMVIIGCNFSLF